MRCALALWMVLVLAASVAVAQVGSDQGSQNPGAAGHLDRPVVTPQPGDGAAPPSGPVASEPARKLPVEVVEGEVTVELDPEAAGSQGRGAEEEEAEEEEGIWYDGVHYVGVTGGIVAFLALLGGLYILRAFPLGKRLKQRMRMRSVHMSAGALAVLLALGHAIGRTVQFGELEFGLGSPQLTTAFFVLAAVTGIVRHRPPGALAGRPALLAWLHRIAIAGALVFLVLHGQHEYSVFAAH